MSKEVRTRAGVSYAVRSSAGCSVTDENGIVVLVVESGKQGVFVADGNIFTVDDENAKVQEVFNVAPAAGVGGGEKEANFDSVESNVVRAVRYVVKDGEGSEIGEARGGKEGERSSLTITFPDTVHASGSYFFGEVEWFNITNKEGTWVLGYKGATQEEGAQMIVGDDEGTTFIKGSTIYAGAENLTQSLTNFNDHENNGNIHVSSGDRTAWNAKASPGVLPVVNELPADLALLPGNVYCLGLGVSEAYDWSGLTIAREGEAVLGESDFLTAELCILSTLDNEITWPADMVWLEGAAPTLQPQFFHQIVLRNDGFKLIGNVAYVYELA